MAYFAPEVVDHEGAVAVAPGQLVTPEKVNVCPPDPIVTNSTSCLPVAAPEKEKVVLPVVVWSSWLK